MNVRRHALLAVSLLVSIAATASATSYKGYIRIDGIQGPVSAMGHEKWSELATSDITIDATPGEECFAMADVLLKHAATQALARVGDVVPEVEIELLTTQQNDVRTFTATLEDVTFNRVTTSSVKGQQIERIEMNPSRIVIETREIKANGQVMPVGHFVTECGGGRAP